MESVVKKQDQRKKLNKAIEEYLARGGRITKVNLGQEDVSQSSNNFRYDPDDFPDLLSPDGDSKTSLFRGFNSGQE